jgi:hypothetical protein
MQSILNVGTCWHLVGYKVQFRHLYFTSMITILMQQMSKCLKNQWGNSLTELYLVPTSKHTYSDFRNFVNIPVSIRAVTAKLKFLEIFKRLATS